MPESPWYEFTSSEAVRSSSLFPFMKLYRVVVAMLSGSLWSAGAVLAAGFAPSTPSTHEAEKLHRDRAEVRSSGAAPAGPLTLWYGKPAANWNEALPIGNGRLGGMVFGGVADELVQLNEESI